jgi:hypothetical protein
MIAFPLKQWSAATLTEKKKRDPTLKCVIMDCRRFHDGNGSCNVHGDIDGARIE